MIRLPNIGLTFSDGDEWEDFCQCCLKIKHQHQNFKSVPADSGGDYGLDGFNADGDVYQCYCPEKEYSDEDLYKHQRTKVTNDIQKLYDYQDKIRLILNGVKIKRWHFTTPVWKSKDLILHCNVKQNLVKSWGLDIIDEDFQITLKDYEYFLPEIPNIIDSERILKPMNYQELDFQSPVPNTQTIEDFKAAYENNKFVENGLRKNAKLYPNNGVDYSDKVIQRTDSDIEFNIIGEGILKQWSNSYDKHYEKFIRVKNVLGKQIKADSLIPVKDNNEKLKEINNKVRAMINQEFHFLSQSNREELISYLVSYWILECSLDFS